MSTETQTAVPERPGQFVATIKELSQKRLLSELDEDILRLVAAVQKNGGVGTLTVKLKFRAMGDNEMGVLPDVKVELPKKAKNASTFFVTEEGILTRDNPDQDKLPGMLNG